MFRFQVSVDLQQYSVQVSNAHCWHRVVSQLPVLETRPPHPQLQSIQPSLPDNQIVKSQLLQIDRPIHRQRGRVAERQTLKSAWYNKQEHWTAGSAAEQAYGRTLGVIATHGMTQYLQLRCNGCWVIRRLGGCTHWQQLPSERVAESARNKNLAHSC
jgi:hypothetical protein